MGRSKRLRNSLIGKPCIFCAGARVSDTVEHIPPRVFFLKKERPRGYEFPACESCNNGSSQQDQVAAMFASISGSAMQSEVYDQQTHSLMRGVANNAPEVIHYVATENSSEVRVDGQPLFFVPVDRRLFHYWLNPWAAKQAIGLWSEHTKKTLGAEDRILVQWITNASLIEEGLPIGVVDALGGLGLFRSGRRDFSNQFAYRYGISETREYGAFLMIFHSSCAVLTSIVSLQTMKDLTRQFGFGEQFRVTSYGIERSLD